MPKCVTCGDELHPERAEKYDYCTKPDCRARNARGLDLVAVSVNKAADQFVALNERTEREMANGRYQKRPEAVSAPARRPRAPAAGPPVRDLVPRSSAPRPRPRWSQAQENLASIYRAMGMTPDAIAKKLRVSPWLVSQILMASR